MVYFALANKAKPPMTIAETHGRPTRGINTRRVSRPRPHTQKAEPEPVSARRSHDRCVLPLAARVADHAGAVLRGGSSTCVDAPGTTPRRRSAGCRA